MTKTPNAANTKKMNNNITVKWIGIIIAIVLAFGSIIFTSLNAARVAELASQLRKIEACEARISSHDERLYNLEAADRVCETNMQYIKEYLLEIKEMLKE